MQPISAPPSTFRRSFHGQIHEDPYCWLSRPKDPRVISHLQEEHDRVNAEIYRLHPLRSALEEEFRASAPRAEADLPVRRGDWWYYGYIVNGQQYPCVRRVPASGPDERPPSPVDLPESIQQTVIDFNTLVGDGEYLRTGGFECSENGDRVVYAVDLQGRESYTLHVRELPSGRTRQDELIGIGPGAVMTSDGLRIFYSKRDRSWRCDTIWEHVIGADQRADRVLYHEKDERFHLTFRISHSDRFLIIHSESRTTTEEMLFDLTTPDSEVVPVWARQSGMKYTVEHLLIGGNDRLVALHNCEDQSDRFVISEIPYFEDSKSSESHRILIPGPDVQLLGLEAFEKMIVISFKADARDGLLVIQFSPFGKPSRDVREGVTLTEWALNEGYAGVHVVDIDDPLAEIRALSNQQWSQHVIRMQTTSFARPPSFIEYDPIGHTSVTLQSQIVPNHGSFDQYRSERLWATADDGTRVPISLLWNNDAIAEGPAPMVLYAYGAYGVSIHASFDATRLSLLDRGVVCAIAHVRGGGELGAAWHAGGRLLAKKNTFTDLVACACELISRGRTAPKKIVLEGGSAGGLTVAAGANLAPQLFAGVIADVPFVDPLNTMLDATSPLTVTEWEEWGNPLESVEAFEYIRSYSPYENIPDGADFPRVLALTSMFDARVAYFEAAKWVVRLRDHGADALLNVEPKGGHARITGREAAYESAAFVCAWLLDTLGIHDTRPPCGTTKKAN